MTAGTVIVAVCAFGGLIACAAFWWATRTGQFSGLEEAKYLVFDDEDEVERPEKAGAPGRPDAA
jgi:cbb3-type cytochrome oxidase maturation protein